MNTYLEVALNSMWLIPAFIYLDAYELPCGPDSIPKATYNLSMHKTAALKSYRSSSFLVIYSAVLHHSNPMDKDDQ